MYPRSRTPKSSEVRELEAKCEAEIAAAEEALHAAWFEALQRFHEQKNAAEAKLGIAIELL